MKVKDLIAPIAALLAAVVLLAASAVLRPVSEEREATSRAEIMFNMLPTRPASFSEEAYDGEDECIRQIFKAGGRLRHRGQRRRGLGHRGGCVLQCDGIGWLG